MKKTVSLRKRVFDFIMANGAVTTSQIFAAVSRHIPASRAASVGVRMVRLDREELRKRRRFNGEHRPRGDSSTNPSKLVSRGRRRIIAETIHALVYSGKIIRTAKVTYAPPKPRLYKRSKAG